MGTTLVFSVFFNISACGESVHTVVSNGFAALAVVYVGKAVGRLINFACFGVVNALAA